MLFFHLNKICQSYWISNFRWHTFTLQTTVTVPVWSNMYGAGTMAGKSKGTAQLLFYLHSIQKHCASHRLNLYVVKYSALYIWCSKLIKYHGSLTISQKAVGLEKLIDDGLFTNEKCREIKRDVSYLVDWMAFESFVNLFKPIVCCLKE